MPEYRICNRCGSVFEFGLSGPYGECPYCGSSDTSRAEQCRICGEYYDEDESKAYWICDECLDKYMNEVNFARFLTSGGKSEKHPDLLEDFILWEYYGIGKCIEESSEKFKSHCGRIYVELATEGVLMEKIKDYLEDVGYSEFADWAVEAYKGGELVERSEKVDTERNEHQISSDEESVSKGNG